MFPRTLGPLIPFTQVCYSKHFHIANSSREREPKNSVRSERGYKQLSGDRDGHILPSTEWLVKEKQWRKQVELSFPNQGQDAKSNKLPSLKTKHLCASQTRALVEHSRGKRGWKWEYRHHEFYMLTSAPEARGISKQGHDGSLLERCCSGHREDGYRSKQQTRRHGTTVTATT